MLCPPLVPYVDYYPATLPLSLASVDVDFHPFPPEIPFPRPLLRTLGPPAPHAAGPEGSLKLTISPPASRSAPAIATSWDPCACAFHLAATHAAMSFLYVLMTEIWALTAASLACYLRCEAPGTCSTIAHNVAESVLK